MKCTVAPPKFFFRVSEFFVKIMHLQDFEKIPPPFFHVMFFWPNEKLPFKMQIFFIKMLAFLNSAIMIFCRKHCIDTMHVDLVFICNFLSHKFFFEPRVMSMS